jgi:hypothetical protein
MMRRTNYRRWRRRLFEPVVTALSNFRREGPKPLVYRYAHGT